MLESLKLLNKEELEGLFQAFSAVAEKRRESAGSDALVQFYYELAGLCKAMAVSRQAQIEELEQDYCGVWTEWNGNGPQGPKE